MAPQPEQQARGNIDRLLAAAGWHVCDASAANIHAARGVAIREFPLPGYGFADYLLYIDGKAAGVVEAKKEGVIAQEIVEDLEAALEQFREILADMGEVTTDVAGV